jgi:hypothetical protein
VPSTSNTLSVVVNKARQAGSNAVGSLTDDRYKTLAFAKETKWPMFMNRFAARLRALERRRGGRMR